MASTTSARRTVQPYWPSVAAYYQPREVGGSRGDRTTATAAVNHGAARRLGKSRLGKASPSRHRRERRTVSCRAASRRSLALPQAGLAVAKVLRRSTSAGLNPPDDTPTYATPQTIAIARPAAGRP